MRIVLSSVGGFGALVFLLAALRAIFPAAAASERMPVETLQTVPTTPVAPPPAIVAAPSPSPSAAKPPVPEHAATGKATATPAPTPAKSHPRTNRTKHSYDPSTL